MTINKREILRYFGYRGNCEDSGVLKIIDDTIASAEKSVAPKSLYNFKPCRTFDGGAEIGGVKFLSRDIEKYLTGCEEAALMACTLGVQSDFFIRSAQSRGNVYAMAAQAVLTEFIEAYCNDVQDGIRDEAAKKGFSIKPRYSHGYGDLDIKYQREFFQLLDISRRIGISLSDRFIMSPSKSVTAIIGLKREK